MGYARSRKLKFRKDLSNESPEYLRNRIRLELLPRLQKEYNPRIKQRLAAAASALAVESDFVDNEAKLLTNEMVIEARPGWVLFHADLLASLHPALRKRIVSSLVSLAKLGAPMLEASHFGDADALLCAAAGRLDLPGRLRLEVSGGTGLVSETTTQRALPRETFTVSVGGKTVVASLNVVVKTKLITGVSSPSRLVRLCAPNRQYFDADAVRPPLEIRTRRPGDSFGPLGTRGTKKLKDFFIDKKVPRFLRDHVPLLLSNGRIMWVMGYAVDRKFMLKPTSTAALRVDYDKRTFGSSPEQKADF
jgi:tRNA(Ile)-lysidine synthase